MRIAIASDLHLEFGGVSIKPNDAEVLILSGDICVWSSWCDKYLNFFKRVSYEYKDIIYIMGNHEFYGGTYSEVTKYIQDELIDFPNIHILDNFLVRLDDVKFVGSTLWTDCNHGDRVTREIINRGLNDFRLIKLNPVTNFRADDSYYFHMKAVDFLMNHTADKEKTVVVTHHAPSYKSVAKKFKNDPLNYAYASDLEALIVSRPHIKLWTHGHTHTKFDYQVGETRVICNPRGYFGYETNSGYFKARVIDV